LGRLFQKAFDYKVSRRSFIKGSAVTAAGIGLLGKGSGLNKVSDAFAQEVAEKEEKWIAAACWHNCGGRCLNKVLVEDGVVIRQKTDDTHPDSPDYPQQRGCLRGRSQRFQVFGADRLKYPMKRKNWEPGGGDKSLRGRDEWVRISWEEALDLVASELKKTSPIYKAANKAGQVFEYKLPSKNEYPNWVKKRFRSKGKMVTGGVPKLMVECIGYNLNQLENEIEKVSLYFDDKAEINEEDVSKLICESGEKSIFDLVDSIGKRDKNSAFSCLNQIMEQKSDPPQLIFFMIVRQFRLLLKTRALIDRDLPDGVIAKELKVPFFVAKKLRDQCGNFSLQQLEAIYRVLTEIDKALKTSEREPKLLLEGLILQVTE